MNIYSILFIVLGVISCINLVLVVLQKSKLDKYQKMYERTLAKFDSKENIEDEFQTIYNRLNEVENLSNNTVDKVNNFELKTKVCVQKIGFVKYNAYDDTENKLSFAIALLDDNNNGIIINHVYSKHGSNFYSKLVKAGEVDERITSEEDRALKEAIDYYTYNDIKPIELVKINKKREIRKLKQKNK